MLFLSQRTDNTPTTNYFRYNALRRIFASRLTLTAIQNLNKMNNKNRLVAPVIEKIVYESSDNHNEVDNKKRQASNLIQKITSIIFCIISFGYGIGERSNEIQIEIVKHITMDSKTRFCCMEFTYTNISKICFSTTFSFTSITYLQEMNEATEVPTRNTGINKKFQLLELHLQIHVERGTYADRLTCLLQIIIERLLHLIIILCYKRSNIPKTLKKTIPQRLFLFIRFTTTFTITSFSSVRLSAIINVSATKVLSAIRFLPFSP